MDINLEIFRIIDRILKESNKPFDLSTIKAEILEKTDFVLEKIRFNSKRLKANPDKDYRFLVQTYLDFASENGHSHAFVFFKEVFFDDILRFYGNAGWYFATLYAINLVGLHSLYDLDTQKIIDKNYSLETNFISHLYSRSCLDFPLIIMGETGTGKELLGKVIHTLSQRRKALYRAINCAAIPEKILESELFGYEQGAFTDAKKRKLGLLELTDGGTVFLDELGKMPKRLQAKILRAIEEKQFLRLGGNKEIEINIRFIAAIQPVEREEVLPDLLYRLGYPDIIKMPTLNETLDTIGMIVIIKTLERITKKIADECISKIPIRDESLFYKRISNIRIDEKVIYTLMNHKYKGNYRELENILRGAILSSATSSRNYISSDDLNLISALNEDQNIIDNTEQAQPVSSNERIKLKDIINHANSVRSSLVEKKVIEVLRQGIDLKAACIAEGLAEKEYQNLWKKIIKITGKSIKEIRLKAYRSYS